MTIGAIGAAPDAAASKASLGLQDFMKILLTQLTYQDPLKPMDNQAFMAQMAQFTALEQSKRLNDLYAADTKEADGEIGRIDFDPFINGQDYDVTKVEVSEPYIAGGKAVVRVNVVNFGKPDEFGLLLVQEDGGWKVDDVWNANAEYGYDLLDILQAPMP